MMEVSRDLVLRINEVFHNYEAESYNSMHTEILEDEIKNWEIIRNIVKNNKSSKDNLRILDYGTGTGFASKQILSLLGKNDKIHLVDLSDKMLELCRNNLTSGKNTSDMPELYFQKNELQDLFDNDLNYDVIMLSSVLHHMPDPMRIFDFANKKLNNNGLLIIWHEPSKRFYRNLVIRLVYNSFINFYMFKKYLGRIIKSKKKQLESNADSPYYKTYLDINKELKNSSINIELDINQISAIVDLHSPTSSGSFSKNTGFDFRKMMKDHTNFIPVLYKSYNFMGKLSKNNFLINFYDKLFSKLFPYDGLNWGFVLKKIK